MSASALTALTVLVGLFGGLIYLWGERSAFPWMRFGAVAVLVFAIGVAVATWPSHHLAAGARAGLPGTPLPASGGPAASPDGGTDFGSAAVDSDGLAARVAGGTVDLGSGYFGSLVNLTGGSGWTPDPNPSPRPTTSGPPPSPTPSDTPSPSPSDTPSPSPSDTPTPSPSDTPSPSPSDSPSPSPSDTPTPSPSDTPSPSPSDSPSPSPSDPSPSPTEMPGSPEPSPPPGLRVL